MSLLLSFAEQLPGTSYQVADFFAKLEWWQVIAIVILIVLLKVSGNNKDKDGRG